MHLLRLSVRHCIEAGIFWSLGALLALSSLGTVAQAQSVGDLLIAPTRLVLEGDTRTASLTLLNIGKDTATYRISFIHLRMTATGGTEGDRQAGSRRIIRG